MILCKFNIKQHINNSSSAFIDLDKANMNKIVVNKNVNHLNYDLYSSNISIYYILLNCK